MARSLGVPKLSPTPLENGLGTADADAAVWGRLTSPSVDAASAGTARGDIGDSTARGRGVAGGESYSEAGASPNAGEAPPRGEGNAGSPGSVATAAGPRLWLMRTGAVFVNSRAKLRRLCRRSASSSVVVVPRDGNTAPRAVRLEGVGSRAPSTAKRCVTPPECRSTPADVAGRGLWGGDRDAAASDSPANVTTLACAPPAPATEPNDPTIACGCAWIDGAELRRCSDVNTDGGRTGLRDSTVGAGLYTRCSTCSTASLTPCTV